MQKIIPTLFVLMCTAFVLLPQVFPPSSHNLPGLPNIRYGDTILIRVGYAGCGEFGGHQEMIKVFQERVDHRVMDYEKMIQTKRPFFAEYWVDSLECTHSTDKKFLLLKHQQLTSTQEAIVLRYIQGFIPASLQQRKMDALMYGNIYLVYLPEYGDETVKLSYSSLEKDVFQELRGKLFTK